MEHAFFYSVTFFHRKSENELWTTREKEQCKNRWGKLWHAVSHPLDSTFIISWINIFSSVFFFFGFIDWGTMFELTNWCKNRFEHFLLNVHVAIRTYIRTRHEIQWLNKKKSFYNTLTIRVEQRLSIFHHPKSIRGILFHIIRMNGPFFVYWSLCLANK